MAWTALFFFFSLRQRSVLKDLFAGTDRERSPFEWDRVTARRRPGTLRWLAPLFSCSSRSTFRPRDFSSLLIEDSRTVDVRTESKRRSVAVVD
jgi:hypothetical protein